MTIKTIEGDEVEQRKGIEWEDNKAQTELSKNFTRRGPNVAEKLGTCGVTKGKRTIHKGENGQPQQIGEGLKNFPWT